LVFGRCQGSGRQPYQVTVDLTEPAFRCTCPSRKFPCKHGLALLLLWVEHGDAVGEAAAATDFAHDWATDRAARRAATEARNGAGGEVADPEARARRAAEREATMSAGLDELERWLGDLVRQGLAGARRQPYGFWDAMAARLVDAQMPALAERVRSVGGGLAARADWADVLLAEAGRWELAVRAWRSRSRLDPAVVADLRVFLGWSRRADEVAGFERVRDRWVVAGVRQGQDDRILSQRTWLWGRQTGRWAVVLDFAAAGAALRTAHVVGAVVDDEVTLYPGSDPPRAVLSGAQQVVASGALPDAVPVAEAVDRLSVWLGANPWRDRLPLALADVVVIAEGDRWWVQDEAGDRLPLAMVAAPVVGGGRRPASLTTSALSVDPWTLLALSGGHPSVLVGEWEAGRVTPLAIAPTSTTPVPL
jgi:hypothetical protein